jgi:hypothetical protein
MTKANKTKRAKHHTENYNGKQHPDLGQMWDCPFLIAPSVFCHVYLATSKTTN